jgi:hypothetical protein
MPYYMSFQLVWNLSSKQWCNRKKDSEQVGMTKNGQERCSMKVFTDSRSNKFGYQSVSVNLIRVPFLAVPYLKMVIPLQFFSYARRKAFATSSFFDL